jgi:hypothetical protein
MRSNVLKNCVLVPKRHGCGLVSAALEDEKIKVYPLQSCWIYQISLIYRLLLLTTQCSVISHKMRVHQEETRFIRGVIGFCRKESVGEKTSLGKGESSLISIAGRWICIDLNYLYVHQGFPLNMGCRLELCNVRKE